MADELAVKRTALGKRAEAMLGQAKELTVSTPDDYEYAAAALLSIANVLRDVKELLDPVCKAAHEAHRVATGQRAEITQPLETAEQLLKGKMLVWQREQDRLARLEQARLQREAEERAKAALQAAQAEAAQRGADEHEIRSIETATPPPAPIARIATPKVAGVSTAEQYTAQIERLDLFLKSQIELAGFGLLAHPNVVAELDRLLAAQARTAKLTMSVPGVRVWDKGKMSVRS